MPKLETVAVVGGSLAGLRSVEALRRRGYDGKVVWIGAERHTPYDRPPLSKQVLDGRWPAERVFFRKAEGFAALHAELQFGRRAVSLDAQGCTLQLDDGTVVPYDGLVIATGARARTLPGAPALAGIFTVRTLDDALGLRAALEQAPRVVIIGAGFIGLEVAAACRKLGLDVTIIDLLDVPLVRALGREVGTALERVHRDEGVKFVFGRSVQRIEGTGRVERVILDDGARLDADVVVVGIGAVPETEWLSGSGLELADGVVCDASCAAARNVVAAGDVARWPNALFERSLRVEHWTQAVEQANAAVDRLLDGEPTAKPFVTAPYFWSDQYDVKVQFVGHFEASDTVHVLEQASSRQLTAVYERKGRLTGAAVFNRPAALMRLRARVAEGARMASVLP